MKNKPFIPRDKPKSWVICVLSGLLGLAFGLCAFAAASYGWSLVKVLCVACFVASWVVGAISGIIFGIGLAKDKYDHLEDKDWHEQLW